MWVLLVFAIFNNVHIESVPGFSTEKSCKEAIKKVYTDNTFGLKVNGRCIYVENESDKEKPVR